jgi:hypothetical protein
MWLAMILRYLLPEFTCMVRGQGHYMRVHSCYLTVTPHSSLISWSVSVGQESLWHQPVCSVNHINLWYKIQILSKSRVCLLRIEAICRPVTFFCTNNYTVIKMKLVCLWSDDASLTSRRGPFRIWYDMLYLTAIGFKPRGSSTVHIYTQTIHRTTQFTN